MGVDALFQQRHGPWLDQDIFRLEIGHDVCEIARHYGVFHVLGLSQRIGQRPPDSRQIHLAVAGFRRTRRQIQFPVARARDRGIEPFRPLREARCAKGEREQHQQDAVSPFHTCLQML